MNASELVGKAVTSIRVNKDRGEVQLILSDKTTLIIKITKQATGSDESTPFSLFFIPRCPYVGTARNKLIGGHPLGVSLESHSNMCATCNRELPDGFTTFEELSHISTF